MTRVSIFSTGGRLALLAVTVAVLGMTAAHGAATAARGGDDVTWKGFSEGLGAARESGKVVLVDVYTGWCGWCKKMDRDIYGDARVRTMLADHFIPVKLDAESGASHPVDNHSYTEREIAQGLGIKSYPTTVFMTPAGDVITLVPGYIPVDKFLVVLEYISSEAYKTQSWHDFVAAKSAKP